MDIESGVGGFDKIVFNGDFIGSESVRNKGIVELSVVMNSEVGVNNEVVVEFEIASNFCRITGNIY